MSWNGFRRLMWGRKKDDAGSDWMRCEGCENLVLKAAVAQRLQTCPDCNHHFNMPANERLASLLDPGSFEELWQDMKSKDPLSFEAVVSYTEKLEESQRETEMNEAAMTGVGAINGIKVAIGVTDSRFIMGSMGSVVGEKITRLTELAKDRRIPLIIVSGSGGGARMYEGCLSLMQMAKTSAALARLDSAGCFYISVLTDPTMGGVMASFAALGDIVIGEPGALLGFTGPRVIQQTLKQELPKGFQRAEFLLAHGFIDRIVHRTKMREELSRILAYVS
ncbi:MAG: acetyl-CoA carboxylase, carboxyltransferase subunit beta [Planctomycetota bacterium]|nr:acetyl-CoA carboxylase, carboxyltransferase subunit beta [Planctomycetota bacterium]